MRILLTNDDGIDSPYLQTMRTLLEEAGTHEVVVVAPERQRSAMSQSITLHKPLRVVEQGERSYAVSGTPVDCVYIGILKLAGPIDLVVSGPNDGLNLGTDVFYSGTVGAALEGGMRGVDSIAVSVERGADASVPVAARHVAELAARMQGEPAEVPRVWNVNVSEGDEEELIWTRLGRRHYHDDVHERTDPRGRSYYWIGGGIAGFADIEGTDCEVVIGRKRSSVSPLRLDLSA